MSLQRLLLDGEVFFVCPREIESRLNLTYLSKIRFSDRKGVDYGLD